MVWTSPRTWVAGEKPTASTLNTHIRDNLKAIGDAWTTYGTGASWQATSVNPAIGNGTWDAAYMSTGKLTAVRISITMGSTTTYGTGTYTLALPVTAAGGRWMFSGTLRDSSASASHLILGEVTTSTINLRALPGTAGNAVGGMSSTSPITLATGDTLFISGTYEAA